jgi:hypothetical protein
MAYAFHIERKGNEISIEEWITVVEKLDGVRLSEAGLAFTNRKTGEVISIPSNVGDVDVLFHTRGLFGLGAKSEWRTCIRFSSGKGSFSGAQVDIESPDNPVRIAAVKLAKILNAKIAGDEGEIYEW